MIGDGVEGEQHRRRRQVERSTGQRTPSVCTEPVQ
jgi:hypothetical protein